VALGIALTALLLLPFLALGLAMPRPADLSQLPAARTLVVADGTWRYEEAGTGDEVLLLHGFNQDAGAWDAVWDRLGACGCRRIRVDLPGFGGSRFRGGDYGLARQAERLEAFLDALGLGRVTVVGVSMGGSLAAWFAAGHPERVARLVLLSPSGHEGALTHGGLFGHLVRPGHLNAAATSLARTRLFGALFPRSVALQALTVSAGYGPAWAGALGRIAAPTDVAWAKADPVASPASAQSIAEAIPRARLVWFDESAGHSLPQSRPQQVADLLCAPAGAARP
jgi:pimeloyl-ACP methyl ester carboxylesterase